MASTYYELDCGEDELATIERLEDGTLVFHNWDYEIEAAAVELGFRPSGCYLAWLLIRDHDNNVDRALIESAHDGQLVKVNELLHFTLASDLASPDTYNEAFASAWENLQIGVAERIFRTGRVDIKKAGGDWALFEAIRRYQPSQVAFLIEAGVDVHASDPTESRMHSVQAFSDTLPDGALRLAIRSAQPDIVKLLLRAGADPDASDQFDMTSWDIAEAKQREEANAGTPSWDNEWTDIINILQSLFDPAPIWRKRTEHDA